MLFALLWSKGLIFIREGGVPSGDKGRGKIPNLFPFSFPFSRLLQEVYCLPHLPHLPHLPNLGKQLSKGNSETLISQALSLYFLTGTKIYSQKLEIKAQKGFQRLSFPKAIEKGYSLCYF